MTAGAPAASGDEAPNVETLPGENTAPAAPAPAVGVPAPSDGPPESRLSEPAPSEGALPGSAPSSETAPSRTPSEAAPIAVLDPGFPAGETEVGAEPAPEAPNEAAADVPDDAAGELPSEPARVIVSFTFDDTYAEQSEAAAILEAHGLRGTFYVNSPQLHRASARPEENNALDIDTVLGLQASGHDIGGHTLGHLSLTDVPQVERVRELAGDRAQLLALGIEARSFAYPYGHVEDDDLSLGEPVLEIARQSGYTSARDTNGFDLENCSPGPESLPPADAFILRSTRSVNEPPPGEATRSPLDDADTLLGWVDRAASCGGGWLPLVFHHLHADCSSPEAAEAYCFDFAELDRLAAELATGTRCPEGSEDPESCYRVAVATVSDGIGSTELAPAPEVPGLRNASLERSLDSGETECIRRTGESGASFGRSELAHSGAASERVELEQAAEAPAELGLQRDFGECAIFASEGHRYQLSLHYRAEPADEPPTLRMILYRLSSDYEWLRWESGNAFTPPAPGEWVRLEATSSPVPPGTLAISFGLRIESPGALNIDDLDSRPLGPE